MVLPWAGLQSILSGGTEESSLYVSTGGEGHSLLWEGIAVTSLTLVEPQGTSSSISQVSLVHSLVVSMYARGVS